MMATVILSGYSLAFAQTGAWISHSYSAFGTGNRIYKCGDNCLAFTYEYATKILFFDITHANWVELNFDTTQHFLDVLANGKVLFACTDSLLIAFNGLTSNWDTVRYQGTPLHPSSSPTEIMRSYQSGENLAIFVTDQKFYIYDITLDSWNEYDYTLPTDYSGVGYYWVSADYAGVLLYRTNQAYPTNLAYSMITHGFAETDRGTGYAGQDDMDNGFAGAYYWDTSITCYVVGYSAQTNQFTHVDIPPGYYISIGGFLTEDYFGDHTIFETTARKVIEINEIVRYIVYCHDTRLGIWTTQTYDLDPHENPGFGGWFFGGRFANVRLSVNDDSTLTTGFYSGFTGQIYGITSGIRYHGHNFQCEGGTAFCLADNDCAWGYNIESGQSATTPIIEGSLRQRLGGEKYVSFNLYDYSDTSYTYFYHAPTNTWQVALLTNASGTAYTAGKDVFAIGMTGSTPGVCFYSSQQNQISIINFASGSSVTVLGNDAIAVASSANRTVLFDACHGNTFEFDITFPSNGLGKNAVLLANSSTNTLYAYSAVTNATSQLPVASTPYRRGVNNYVGLAYLGSGTTFYAFNAIYGNWVELVPTGNNIGSEVGDRTALVVRNNIVYAFDPQGSVTIEDDYSSGLQPVTFELAQNYPNPFNSSTTISYRLTENADVTIEIFDILGRLVQKYPTVKRQPGEYSIVWDSGQHSSGCYYYRLKADKHTEIKQMLLLK
jgi:hypothetical protein